jgi:hypothetical protein
LAKLCIRQHILDVEEKIKGYQNKRVAIPALLDSVKNVLSTVHVLTPVGVVANPILVVCKHRSEHKYDKRVTRMLFLPSERPNALITGIVS